MFKVIDGNLIVLDDEYAEYAAAITAFGKKAEDRIAQYYKIMARVGTEGIMEGEMAENLKFYQRCIEAISGTVEDLTLEFSNNMKRFVKEIDLQDEYLY